MPPSSQLAIGKLAADYRCLRRAASSAKQQLWPVSFEVGGTVESAASTILEMRANHSEAGGEAAALRLPTLLMQLRRQQSYYGPEG